MVDNWVSANEDRISPISPSVFIVNSKIKYSIIFQGICPPGWKELPRQTLVPVVQWLVDWKNTCQRFPCCWYIRHIQYQLTCMHRNIRDLCSLLYFHVSHHGYPWKNRGNRKRGMYLVFYLHFFPQLSLRRTILLSIADGANPEEQGNSPPSWIVKSATC